MKKAGKRMDGEELKTVYNAIEDHVFEHHKLCSITDISQQSGLTESKCRKNVEYSLKKEKIMKHLNLERLIPLCIFPHI